MCIRHCFQLALCLLLPAGLAAQQLVVNRGQGDGPREQLTHYLTGIGLKQLDKRRSDVAALDSRAAHQRRRQEVRAKILRLLGGLPDYRGPLNVQAVGVLDRGDYKIEKIIYESLPKFYVTANVYVPARGRPPYPAVLMPVGHSQEGKEGERQTAVGLARKGFIALKYDPVGQGERLQYYDPDLGASKVGGPTAEHSHMNGHTVLIGDNVARYRIWDGMRGIDYLVSRKDVDPDRIGCTGCSGGGTLTTYISALDDRVKAAAPACYITSWREMLPALGPQDAEQSFPDFLREGLEIADYVELFAPKPWLIANTIADFFPLEGARQTYDEARRIYALYGAENNLEWFIGPGGHGVPLESREAIYDFFIRRLNKGEGSRREEPVKLDRLEQILCTKTGQVSDSLGGETVFTLNRKRAADIKRAGGDLAEAVRRLARIAVQPGGAPPELAVHASRVRDSYRLQLVSFEAEGGVRVPGMLLLPDAAGPKPAVIVADARPRAASVVPEDWSALARAGFVVFAVYPRGIPETGQPPSNSLVGDHSMAARAFVVGRTLVGLRAEDIIRAVDSLAAHAQVDRARIAGFAHGSLTVPMLHAAVLDRRIGRLVLEQGLARYRLAVERPIHRSIHEIAVPGALRAYDLDDLASALAPRQVTLVDPVDALGRPLRGEGVHRGRGDSLAGLF